MDHSHFRKKKKCLHVQDSRQEQLGVGGLEEEGVLHRGHISPGSILLSVCVGLVWWAEGTTVYKREKDPPRTQLPVW